MKIFAFLINYNNSALSKECVDSLLRSAVEGLIVCVIDNGSRKSDYDSLVEHCKKCSVLYTRIYKNIGYSRAVNHGLRIALSQDADYILTLNNDCTVMQGSITALVEASKRYGDKCIVSGTVLNKATGRIDYIGQLPSKSSILTPSTPSYEQRLIYSSSQQDLEMGMLDDIMWLYPVSLIRDIGFYSPYFFLYGEQNNFALRALSADYKLIYTPKAVAIHHGSATTANGKTHSPRILYWRVLGALKVYYLYNKKTILDAIFVPLRIYLSYLRHIIILGMKSRKDRLTTFISCLIALHFAFSTFIVWSLRPYKDTGFNPFSI